jgi:hypothetical protein
MKSYRPASVSKPHPILGDLRCRSHEEWRVAFDAQKAGQTFEEALALLPPDDGPSGWWGSQYRAVLSDAADRAAFLASHGAGGQHARHLLLTARLQQLLS